MCKLSIITINYNNALGLGKTMQSVLSQTSKEFEYIVVDGGSNDTSCQIIRDKRLEINGTIELEGIKVTCVSEADKGIYHAMNKGIRIAKGEYVQFVNSGDCLASNDVVEKMLNQLQVISYKLQEETKEGTRYKFGVDKLQVDKKVKQRIEDKDGVLIFYGNMLKQMPKGLLRDKGFAGRQPTMLDFYTGTLNHSPAYIKRSLFDEFGLYDESLKICSDYKWYIKSIIFGGINPQYIDIDVTVFDMTGISTVNTVLDKEERAKVLNAYLPAKVLVDYKKYALPISKWERMYQYRLLVFVFYYIERFLFKYEKFQNKRKMKSISRIYLGFNNG